MPSKVHITDNFRGGGGGGGGAVNIFLTWKKNKASSNWAEDGPPHYQSQTYVPDGSGVDLILNHSTKWRLPSQLANHEMSFLSQRRQCRYSSVEKKNGCQFRLPLLAPVLSKFFLAAAS